jgi:hypothetical protein
MAARPAPGSSADGPASRPQSDRPGAILAARPSGRPPCRKRCRPGGSRPAGGGSASRRRLARRQCGAAEAALEQWKLDETKRLGEATEKSAGSAQGFSEDYAAELDERAKGFWYCVL